MVDYTSTLILALTLGLIYITCHKEHPWIAGTLYIITGMSTFIIMPTNNMYGLIIVAIGLIRFVTTPLHMGGVHA